MIYYVFLSVKVGGCSNAWKKCLLPILQILLRHVNEESIETGIVVHLLTSVFGQDPGLKAAWIEYEDRQVKTRGGLKQFASGDRWVLAVESEMEQLAH